MKVKFARKQGSEAQYRICELPAERSERFERAGEMEELILFLFQRAGNKTDVQWWTGVLSPTPENKRGQRQG